MTLAESLTLSYHHPMTTTQRLLNCIVLGIVGGVLLTLVVSL